MSDETRDWWTWQHSTSEPLTNLRDLDGAEAAEDVTRPRSHFLFRVLNLSEGMSLPTRDKWPFRVRSQSRHALSAASSQETTHPLLVHHNLQQQLTLPSPLFLPSKHLTSVHTQPNRS
jgi:hypothetical protein